MSNETIRGNLVNAINEMTRLLEVCEDENQKFELRIKIRELFQRLDRVIVATLDSGSPEFAEALESIQLLTQKATQAKQKIEKITETITQAAEAIGKVEKLVKNVVGVLAVL